MEQKYTLWQRIVSDTPSFFKRAQILGVSLAGLGTSLTQFNGVPAKLSAILISTGTAIAVIAQFAVKQCEPLNNITHDEDK